MSVVWKFVPPLAVGLGGAGAAALWFYQSRIWTVVFLVVAAVVGLAASWQAEQLIKKNRPVNATSWIYGWGLFCLTAAVAAAAAVIILTVEYGAKEGASTETTKLRTAALAAIGAFLVSVFVKDAEDADETWVGSHFKAKLNKHYEGRFELDSDAHRALKLNEDQGFRGWGPAARRKRAEIIANSLPPPAPPEK